MAAGDLVGNMAASSGGGGAMAGMSGLGSFLTMIPSIIFGGLSYADNKNRAKQQQAAINQMLQNAPKFDYKRNDLFGYSTSPQQDMLSFGLMNSLIKTLVPSAGLDLGDNFTNLWSQYKPEDYAFNWMLDIQRRNDWQRRGINPLTGQASPTSPFINGQTPAPGVFGAALQNYNNPGTQTPFIPGAGRGMGARVLAGMLGG